MKDETYYLQHPSKQKFYVVVAYVGGFFALNTHRWAWFQRPVTKLYDMQRYVVLIFVPITVGSQIFYLFMYYGDHDFASLAAIITIIPVGFVVMVQCGSAQTQAYKKALASFMDTIHLHNYLNIDDATPQKRKYIAEELIFAEKYTRIAICFVGSFTCICFLSWNTVPIIHNIQNNPSIHNITKRLEVCIHFWQPFDYEFDFYAYLFIQILGVYCGGVAVVIMVLFDTVNIGAILHLTGHIQLIKYNLRNDFTGNLTNEENKQKLVQITKYYGFITDKFQELTAAFGLNVALVYGQNLVQGGLLLYQLMSTGRNLETILTFGLMIPICMGILLIMSFILENVRIQADEIPNLVYDIPWQSMSVSNQKIVQSILFQVQPTLEFVAAFNIKTGMQPAINIIKTTFSYYVMIKSRKEMALN